MLALLALAPALVLAAVLATSWTVRARTRRARWRTRWTWTSYQPDRHGREPMPMRWLFYELHPLAKIAVLLVALLGSVAVLVLAVAVAK